MTEMTDNKLYTPAEYKAAHKWLESKVSKEGRFFDTFTFVRWAQLFAEYAAEAREGSLPQRSKPLHPIGDSPAVQDELSEIAQPTCPLGFWEYLESNREVVRQWPGWLNALTNCWQSWNTTGGATPNTKDSRSYGCGIFGICKRASGVTSKSSKKG